MSSLKEKLAALVPKKRDEVKQVIKEFGDRPISEVSVSQAYAIAPTNSP